MLQSSITNVATANALPFNSTPFGSYWAVPVEPFGNNREKYWDELRRVPTLQATVVRELRLADLKIISTLSIVQVFNCLNEASGTA
jgi:hypothetical protein